jgi:hypothetical protein
MTRHAVASTACQVATHYPHAAAAPTPLYRPLALHPHDAVDDAEGPRKDTMATERAMPI